MSARILSLQVREPVEVVTASGTVRTALCKLPVDGAIFLRPRGLEGDGCADLVHHGLEDQAICVIPASHYCWWRSELKLDDAAFPCGSLGENFTVEGQDEANVFLGDRWRVGEAEVEVTKPREPCSTLNKVWQRRDFAALMGRHGLTGWYLRVLQPGMVAAGQELELLWRDPAAPTVALSWAQRARQD